MINKKLAIMAIPMLAAVMFVGAIAPAYAAQAGSIHVNAKILYAENDDNNFLDFVQLVIIETDDGPVATADVFIFNICSSTTVLEDDEYGWSMGEAWVSFDSGACGQVDVTWNSVGKPGKIHLSNSGDSTCDESGFKGVLNGIGRAANVTGTVEGPDQDFWPINHSVDSGTVFGDGFSARGVLSAMLCEATSGQRP
jgi:hypothetical protein